MPASSSSMSQSTQHTLCRFSAFDTSTNTSSEPRLTSNERLSLKSRLANSGRCSAFRKPGTTIPTGSSVRPVVGQPDARCQPPTDPRHHQPDKTTLKGVALIPAPGHIAPIDLISHLRPGVRGPPVPIAEDLSAETSIPCPRAVVGSIPRDRPGVPAGHPADHRDSRTWGELCACP